MRVMTTSKRRRGKGTGSVYQRTDGRWVAQVELGDLVRVRKTFYARTQREAHQKLLDALQRQARGESLQTSRLTLGTFLERWLTDVVQPSRRPSTAESYAIQVRKHLVPALGKTTLSRLTPALIQGHLRQALASGLSPRSVRYQLDVLRTALNKAVDWGLLPENPCARVDPPAQAERGPRLLTPAQAKAFLAAVRDDRLYALYLLAITHGLRRGELLALHWEDVDWDAGVLRIQRALTRGPEGGWQEAATKTRSGRRVVRLTPWTLAALQEHREREGEATPWVFTNEAGRRIDPRRMLARLQDRLRDAGLPVVTLHGLRHSAATLLLALGVPTKVVSEILGHSRTSVTLDLYQHVLQDMQAEASDRLDQFLRDE